jgi:ABC-type branched-subunit amino acid transport system substrate-binding protein
MQRKLALPHVGLIVTWLTLSGCHLVLGLSDYDLQETQVASTPTAYVCRSHADCPGASGSPTATFCTTKRHCVAPQSDDCSPLAGPALDPSALPIGSLFKTTGGDAATELARQRAVQLAVEEINEQGGIPARDNAAARHLLLIGCDATADVDRAASHLAMLGARAIVGLTDSEQMLQVVRTRAISSGMVTLSAAIAPESINSLLDADLAWLMTLTVEQRVPLLEATLRLLEQHLRAERSQPLRLALLFCYDSAGRAGVAALRTYEFDGKPVGSTEEQTGRVRIDRYPDTAADIPALVASYRGFAPDIVVVLGQPDAASAFMTPLEQSYERDAVGVRPHYVLTEEAKGPGLIDLSRALPSLRERIHGVATAIPDRSRPVWESFQRRFVARFNDELASAPRVAAAYDAVYALAYAIAAIEVEHEVGGRIAQALHWLEAPEQTAAPVFEVGPDSLATSFPKLNRGERIAVYGAAGDLHWDDYGALSDGALEAWCVEAGSGASHFVKAPLSYEVAEQRFGSRAALCDPWLAPLADLRGVDMRAQAAMAERNASDGAASSAGASAGRGGKDESDAAGAAGSSAAPAEQPASAGAEAPAGAAGRAAPVATSPAVEATNKTLSCGTALCDSATEQCCVAMLRLTGPTAGDVSCQRRGAVAPMQAGAAGAPAAAACALSLQCTSDAECKDGAVCCADMQTASCKPLESCRAEMGRRLACKTPGQCPQGQQCCMHANGSAFSYTACEATCDIGNGGVRVCTGNTDCQDDAASMECNPISLLPALSVCWPRL